ncbi:acetate/propionate family kinase [Mesomycoplasma lagogenitalium]|uniref:Acetate kinase n=1 Tax=Mesomycoplasma lagogenitalium TaxID=171286 RepID=A0ABY8LUA9_9BACT|nr:acetate/propionate family kinase [Mesomycoplasma lagogenitalium]WGI36300.1 acetate/propionate family kinase [Mesomycoplasma lagogenitalium]
MNKKILVVNAGSSSMKWSLFNKKDFSVIANGISERIGINDSFLKMSFNDQEVKETVDLKNHKDAADATIKMWTDNQVISSLEEIELVGFRVVHGGTYFNDSTKLDEKAINLIDECSKFAPLHNPGAIQAIKAFKEVLPKAKLSASFDTAFHSSLPKINYQYPMNKEFADKYGIRKYGMHGISHKFITLKLQEILKKESVNFVNLHIGNGASLCAVKDSKSYDTSMGFTPLAGVMMGTRSGDIDPAIHEYATEAANISLKEFTNILNKKSGLLGVSGYSSDMRDLANKYQEKDENAIFTLELYSQKIVDYLVNYINKVGKNIDALVFTAGVGENSSLMRELVINKLQLPALNIELDKEKNWTSPKNIKEYLLISSKNSLIPVYVIRTNEELLIAQDALKLNS